MKRVQDRDFILDRLANYNQSVEGAVLPPQISTGNRVPYVARLQISRQTPITNGNVFYLTFIEPDRGDIRNYNVFYAFQNNPSFLIGPVSSVGSPSTVSVLGNAGDRITFYVQTVLTSGMTSSPTNSPSVSATLV